MKENSNPYNDIIHLPAHISKKHTPMSRINRAAQFAPFAALTGYDDKVREEGRLTDSRYELDDDRQDRLNNIIAILKETNENPLIEIVYFCADKLKSGGEYITITGSFRRIEEETLTLIFTDKRRIPLLDIYDIRFLEDGFCFADNYESN